MATTVRNPFNEPEALYRIASGGTGTGVLPQSPPPPQVAVTGGNAPVREAPTIKPNQIDPNTGQLINTGTAVTGGNNPPLVRPPITIKPNQIDPNTGQLINTGTAVTGGNNPPLTGTPFPGVPSNGSQPMIPNVPQQVYTPGMAPAQVIQDITSQLLDPNGAYIANARQRGLETAARRGLGNSSIAAGASQRAAIDAVQPLVNEASNIFNRREGEAFEAEQTIRQQMFTALENQRDRDQQITMSQVQNWLNDQTFQREFNAQLSLLPITSAASLHQMLAQYAMESPEVWTPDVLDGVSNFFNQSFLNILQQYFPSYYGGTGG